MCYSQNSILYYTYRDPDYSNDTHEIFYFYKIINTYCNRAKAYVGYQLVKTLHDSAKSKSHHKKLQKTIKKIATYINQQIEYVENEDELASSLDVIQMCNASLEILKQTKLDAKQTDSQKFYTTYDAVYDALESAFNQINYISKSRAYMFEASTDTPKENNNIKPLPADSDLKHIADKAVEELYRYANENSYRLSEQHPQEVLTIILDEVKKLNSDPNTQAKNIIIACDTFAEHITYPTSTYYNYFEVNYLYYIVSSLKSDFNLDLANTFIQKGFIDEAAYKAEQEAEEKFAAKIFEIIANQETQN